MKVLYKNKLTNLAATMAQSIGFNNKKKNKLQSTNVQDAIDEISNILDEEKTIISDAWNIETTYTVGQYCIYNNTLWKCLVQHNGQVPSEGTYWTKTQIDDEMLAIKNDVSTINSNFTNLIDVFFSSAQLIYYSFDYNNFTTNGLYYLNGSEPAKCTNGPEPCTNCYVIVFGESGRKHQIILSGNNDFAWYRNMITDTTTWKGWKLIGELLS